ncbi:MAG: hypothetical protein DWQ07_10360 [Chloroflexi bacterium]|nr:MAG: hypothetical protein DWQ07_10360 [Chloroflexota bacterium]MBL1192886.1 hypothetical protein [Chloroflexota bacterium]NOH10178.1 hypothetical protein [Chloroflexota bacterium]
MTTGNLIPMTAHVEVRSSSSYAETPVAFHWDGKRLEVDNVRISWRTPIGISFSVVTNDRRIFELHYDIDEDQWYIEPR